ncbi:alpha/beta fold hydrolase [Flammeovirgaceae bacterium SG7u.111]|nr:alpha/beta fold hydrolase [Flammeovirgaceae bacterium SG7u.132]WPO33431.1 alpha/beta fold hydrolase [Flammeovirgaceae bacterium SG7u.111]
MRTILGSFVAMAMLLLCNACQDELEQLEKSVVADEFYHKKKTLHTYVLIHGAWHPESVWGNVQDKLEEFGHTIIAVQLAGLGNDNTPIGSVNLQTHVDQVIAAINAQPEEVILVGHSYGGVVISQVGESIPQKIKRLVYVSAFMPVSGESLIQLSLQDTLSVITQNVIVNPPGIYLPDSILIEAFYNYSLNNNNQPLQQEINDVLPLLRPQPIQTALDTVSLGSNYASLPKNYVACPNDQAVTPGLQSFMYSRFPGTSIHTINNSDHSPFVTRPNQLANYLKKL